MIILTKHSLTHSLHNGGKSAYEQSIIPSVVYTIERCRYKREGLELELATYMETLKHLVSL
jgi:hypothetical protein